jgi:hypothetical protein
MSHHPSRRLRTPDGDRADIDTLLVPLIRALWAAGYETIGCCQDIGESAGTVSERSAAVWTGYALVEMPAEDACRLLDAVKSTPQFKDRMHWADQGAWSVTISVLPFGMGGALAVVPWAQVRFPASQIGDLTDVLTAAPER